MLLLETNNIKQLLACPDYASFVDFLVEHLE